MVDWERVEDGIYRRGGKVGKPIYKAVRQAGKRPDGTYAQQTKTFNGAKIPRALDEAKRWKGQAPGGKHLIPEAANLTLEEAYERLNEGVGEFNPITNPDGYAPATLAWHRALWANFPQAFKSRKLKDISTEELRTHLEAIKARGMRNRARQFVGTIYRFVGLKSPAIKPYVPSTVGRKMREAEAGRIEGRYRTDGEVRSIIRFVPDRYKALMNLMWRIGLRPGEAFALTVGQINPETHQLTIDRAVNDRKIRPTKTGKTRKPFLPDAVFDDLSAHIRTYSDWTNHDALVFTTEAGAMIDTDNFRSRVFSPAVKSAGLPKTVTPYDLRHTAASNLIRAEADIVSVAQNTGHTWQVLMTTYAHAADERLKQVAERMDELILASQTGDQEPVS